MLGLSYHAMVLCNITQPLLEDAFLN
jgi:hypothetical protein